MIPTYSSSSRIGPEGMTGGCFHHQMKLYFQSSELCGLQQLGQQNITNIASSENEFNIFKTFLNTQFTQEATLWLTLETLSYMYKTMIQTYETNIFSK